VELILLFWFLNWLDRVTPQKKVGPTISAHEYNRLKREAEARGKAERQGDDRLPPPQ
jgi:hypothetical protein